MHSAVEAQGRMKSMNSLENFVFLLIKFPLPSGGWGEHHLTPRGQLRGSLEAADLGFRDDIGFPLSSWFCSHNRPKCHPGRGSLPLPLLEDSPCDSRPEEGRFDEGLKHLRVLARQAPLHPGGAGTSRSCPLPPEALLPCTCLCCSSSPGTQRLRHLLRFRARGHLQPGRRAGLWSPQGPVHPCHGQGPLPGGWERQCVCTTWQAFPHLAARGSRVPGQEQGPS